MKRIPLYDETAPIACTIDPGQVAERVALVGRLRAHHTSARRTDDGLELTFPNRPDVGADVRRFAIEEKRCCAFWGFDVRVDPSADAIVLQWDGPPAARDIIDRLAAWFGGGEGDLDTALAGLL